MSNEFLEDLVVIFLLSLLVNLILRRFRMPGVLGFLVTGIIAGPHGLALIRNVHQIEVIAEIGVILLLFTIGIEFSLKSLIRTKRVVFLSGGLHVILITGITTIILAALGRGWNVALFGGFITALSSTAIVMKLLQERAEVQSTYGRIVMGVLIFQDMAVVPMMLMIPLISGQIDPNAEPLWILVVKIVGILLFLFVMIRWVVPKLLHLVALMKRREMFLLTLLLIAFSVAWLTSFIGISLALGAFLAGLIISESEYHQHAFGDILPFRDLFSSFFFVSVGMLLDPAFVAANPVLVISLVLAVLAGKTLFGGLAILFTGYSVATSLVSAIALSQVGEFSFVMAQIGSARGLIAPFDYQLFLSVAVTTMALAPFLITAGPAWGNKLRAKYRSKRWIAGLREIKNPVTPGLENHLVLIGYGRNGRNIARAAKNAGITYAVLDFDAEKVRTARKNKEHIFFGDASHEAVLLQVAINKASVVVMAIADPLVTFRVLTSVRKISPGAYLIIRTRYTEHMDDLYKLGADEVIPEEIETSVKIFSSVMARFLVPQEEISRFESMLRAKGYELLLADDRRKNLIGDAESEMPDVEIASFRIQENSFMAGKSIQDSALRSEYELNILAIKRGEAFLLSPDAEMVMVPGDLVVVFGRNESISSAAVAFRKLQPGDGDLGMF